MRGRFFQFGRALNGSNCMHARLEHTELAWQGLYFRNCFRNGPSIHPPYSAAFVLPTERTAPEGKRGEEEEEPP